jgi:hypothetical protein
MFTYTALTKLCCSLSQEIVCLYVLRLENAAIIRQKILCVYTYCMHETLLVFVKNILCLHLFRLQNSAIILHKILCIYMYSV